VCDSHLLHVRALTLPAATPYYMYTTAAVSSASLCNFPGQYVCFFDRGNQLLAYQFLVDL
jgi:hypothetical protein